MHNTPIAYFITFTTFGTWLHGDPRKSVIHRQGFSEQIDPNAAFYRYEQVQLKHPPVTLDSHQRKIVQDVIVRHCNLRQWRLFALHVRTNHIHIVVQADRTIDQVMKELKSWATRLLRQNGLCVPVVWTSGGSCNYIFKSSKLLEKVHYVIHEQGTPMEYYLDESIRF